MILAIEEVGVNVVGAFFGYGFGPADIYVNKLEQRGSKEMKFKFMRYGKLPGNRTHWYTKVRQVAG